MKFKIDFGYKKGLNAAAVDVANAFMFVYDMLLSF